MLSVDRVILPSRIRRGRLAVGAVWRVRLPNGDLWQFGRKKDATAFAAAGGCTHGIPLSSWCWKGCGGRVVDREPGLAT